MQQEELGLLRTSTQRGLACAPLTSASPPVPSSPGLHNAPDVRALRNANPQQLHTPHWARSAPSATSQPAHRSAADSSHIHQQRSGEAHEIGAVMLAQAPCHPLQHSMAQQYIVEEPESPQSGCGQQHGEQASSEAGGAQTYLVRRVQQRAGNPDKVRLQEMRRTVRCDGTTVQTHVTTRCVRHISRGAR